VILVDWCSIEKKKQYVVSKDVNLSLYCAPGGWGSLRDQAQSNCDSGQFASKVKTDFWLLCRALCSRWRFMCCWCLAWRSALSSVCEGVCAMWRVLGCQVEERTERVVFLEVHRRLGSRTSSALRLLR